MLKTENNVALLVNAVNPKSYVCSKDALALIDNISATELNTPWTLDTKIAFTHCLLQDSVQHTAATQCLIYLFDPGNGWVRDCYKRPDMLLMTAKLVEKGASLKGLSYYENTIEEEIQILINNPYFDPPATINRSIATLFASAGYKFFYPFFRRQQPSFVYSAK